MEYNQFHFSDQQTASKVTYTGEASEEASNTATAKHCHPITLAWPKFTHTYIHTHSGIMTQFLQVDMVGFFQWQHLNSLDPCCSQHHVHHTDSAISYFATNQNNQSFNRNKISDNQSTHRPPGHQSIREVSKRSRLNCAQSKSYGHGSIANQDQ